VEPDGPLKKGKARNSLRGDTMKPVVHYNPNYTSAPMPEKAPVRTVIAIGVDKGLIMEHMDGKAAYKDELYEWNIPVYVKEPKRGDGTYAHGGTVGRLRRKLYGSPSGTYYYIRGTLRYLTSIGYTQMNTDACVLQKKSGIDYILVVVNLDDYLLAATTQRLIDELYRQMAKKYTLKKL